MAQGNFFRLVTSHFFSGSTAAEMKSLPLETMLVAAYLTTSPQSNVTGLYRQPRHYIEGNLGLTPGALDIAFKNLSTLGFATYDEEARAVWVKSHFAVQIEGAISPVDNRFKHITNEIKNCPSSSLKAQFVQRYRHLALHAVLEELPEIDPCAVGEPAKEKNSKGKLRLKKYPYAREGGANVEQYAGGRAHSEKRHKVLTDFWESRPAELLKRLGPAHLLLGWYLTCNPHVDRSGLYYLPVGYVLGDLPKDTIPRLHQESTEGGAPPLTKGVPPRDFKGGETLASQGGGRPLSTDDFSRWPVSLIQSLESTKYCFFDPDVDMVFLPGMLQVHLNANPKPQDFVGVRNYLKTLTKTRLYERFYQEHESLFLEAHKGQKELPLTPPNTASINSDQREITANGSARELRGTPPPREGGGTENYLEYLPENNPPNPPQGGGGRISSKDQVIPIRAAKGGLKFESPSFASSETPFEKLVGFFNDTLANPKFGLPAKGRAAARTPIEFVSDTRARALRRLWDELGVRVAMDAEQEDSREHRLRLWVRILLKVSFNKTLMGEAHYAGKAVWGGVQLTDLCKKSMFNKICDGEYESAQEPVPREIREQLKKIEEKQA